MEFCHHECLLEPGTERFTEPVPLRNRELLENSCSWLLFTTICYDNLLLKKAAKTLVDKDGKKDQVRKSMEKRLGEIPRTTHYKMGSWGIFHKYQMIMIGSLDKDPSGQQTQYLSVAWYVQAGTVMKMIMRHTQKRNMTCSENVFDNSMSRLLHFN